MLLPSLLCLALTLAPAGGRTSDLQTSDSINSVLAKVRMSLPRILKSSRRPPPNLRKNTNNFRKNPFQFTFRKEMIEKRNNSSDRWNTRARYKPQSHYKAQLQQPFRRKISRQTKYSSPNKDLAHSNPNRAVSAVERRKLQPARLLVAAQVGYKIKSAHH